MQEVVSEHVCATRCPVWYSLPPSPPPFHLRPLSCIHYFLVDADDDDDNDGSSGGGDGDGDDDDNYDENRLLSRGRLSLPLSRTTALPSLFSAYAASKLF